MSKFSSAFFMIMQNSKHELVVHPIEPLYDADSRILILGSFPSVKSRETQFFYGHPQNRFWKLLSILFSEPLPKTIEEKKEFVLQHHIALWDVLASCEIIGSSDASILNPIPNDIKPILESTSITHIYTNGKTAYRYYMQYIFPTVDISAECLPSTSPANAAWSIEKLEKAWSVILQ